MGAHGPGGGRRGGLSDVRQNPPGLTKGRSQSERGGGAEDQGRTGSGKHLGSRGGQRKKRKGRAEYGLQHSLSVERWASSLGTKGLYALS